MDGSARSECAPRHVESRRSALFGQHHHNHIASVTFAGDRRHAVCMKPVVGVDEADEHAIDCERASSRPASPKLERKTLDAPALLISGAGLFREISFVREPRNHV